MEYNTNKENIKHKFNVNDKIKYIGNILNIPKNTEGIIKDYYLDELGKSVMYIISFKNRNHYNHCYEHNIEKII